MVLERVAILVILMIEFAALKNVYHPFQFLEKSLHLSGSFYLYCGVVLFGLPIVMIILPETKDLSIAEINSLFKKKNKESS